MTEFTTPTTDPSLRTGDQQKIEPGVLALARDPHALTDPTERAHALLKADELTADCGEMKAARDYDGNPCYAETREKPGDVFAFNREVLQQPESTPNNEKTTHLIIETENGDMLMIRRKSDAPGFDVISTVAAGTENARRDIPDDALKDVVAIVGQPLALGEGFAHGVGGNIARITMVDMSQTLDLKPDSIILSDPDSQTDAVSRFGEAMREKSIEHKPATETESVRKVLGTEAVEQLVAIAPDTTAEKHAYNPYEQFSDEKLERIRDSVIDSIKSGIRQYKPEDVALSVKNLMNIQRDLERRGLEPKPEYARGEKIYNITYVTTLKPSIIEDMVEYLHSIDGGIGIAMGIKEGYVVPSPGAERENNNPSVKLDALEHMTFFDSIAKLYWNTYYPNYREAGGLPIVETENPYATRTNDELAKLVARFETTIAELQSKDREADANSFAAQLMRVKQVIENRKA